mmetsp:Transcript_23672/g.59406  ORF Transcript_23672/g.59406 Transcript_23672/m.59406 type:complete len:218 (-) Transcript_23672:146-799(-)
MTLVWFQWGTCCRRPYHVDLIHLHGKVLAHLLCLSALCFMDGSSVYCSIDRFHINRSRICLSCCVCAQNGRIALRGVLHRRACVHLAVGACHRLEIWNRIDWYLMLLKFLHCLIRLPRPPKGLAIALPWRHNAHHRISPLLEKRCNTQSSKFEFLVKGEHLILKELQLLLERTDVLLKRLNLTVVVFLHATHRIRNSVECSRNRVDGWALMLSGNVG